MSINTNVVACTGRLTRDPKLYPVGAGEGDDQLTYALLPIAINRGEDREPVYYDVKVWNALARACVKYRRKGEMIAVTGRLDQCRQADENHWNYITAYGVEFIGSRREQAGELPA